MRLIDADELTRRIEKSYLTKGEKRLFSIKVRHMPTVELRPQGEWIPNYRSQFCNPGRACSLCGKVVEFSENYCPNCGAYMRG